MSQCAVKNIQVEEILSLAQQARVKLKHRGVDLARLGRAEIHRVGDAHRRRVPRVEVHLHVDARERLRHAPGDFHAHLLGVGKDARFFPDEVQRFQPEPLAGAAGHAGHIGQIVVDDVDVGGVHVDRDSLLDVAVKDDLALVQHDAAGAKLTDR